jgi:hypothetical protein
MKLVLFSCLFWTIASSQEPEKFRFKKEPSIYFFKQGARSDTVEKSTLFYLVVPDSLKSLLVIDTYNGQILKGKNDSLVTIKYMPGLKYETFYTAGAEAANKEKYALKTFINGVSDLPANNLRVVFFDKASGHAILENRYFVR